MLTNMEVRLYCRFCAKLKPPEKLLHFEFNSNEYDEISKTLTFLNANYIDISYPDLLPQSLCFVCYDSLINAYNFLLDAKEAQDVLWDIITKKNSKPAIENGIKCEPQEVLDQNLLLESKPDSNNSMPVTLNNVEHDTDSNESESVIESVNKCDSQDVFNQNPLVEPKVEYMPESPNNVEELDLQNVLDTADKNESNSNDSTYATEDLKEVTDKDALTSWSDIPWMCLYCEAQFENLDSLRQHGKEEHKKCYVFNCICKNYNKHKKKSLKKFIRHIRTKHYSDLSNSCYYCNKRLGNDALLEEHINNHFVNPEKPCLLCGEILSNQAAVDEHVLKYTQRMKYRQHPGTPYSAEELTCKICRKEYNSLSGLLNHRESHEAHRKKNYTCDRCGKSFYKKCQLASHLNSHRTDKPHVCKICNKAFILACRLRLHINTHSDVKPYPCEECGKEFRTMKQLKAHKIIHSDEKRFSCRDCKKQFRFKHLLLIHERQHTGVRPYRCEYCGMEFTNWPNFNKHMKRRHNKDLSKKKVTPQGTFPRNPETGQLIRLNNDNQEEWKSAIMKPCKRRKKKVDIKEA